MRVYSFTDKLCLKTDKLLKMLTGHLDETALQRENPAKNTQESTLTAHQKKHVAGFMRINYAGEICAQALYQGQALTTKNFQLKQTLENAGLEEWDHLFWCQSRLNDLNSKVSILNPLWYTGSLLLGMTAGLCGDEWNLGFLEETEKQVVTHLEYHLAHLPAQDHKTKIILETMKTEEEHHAKTAQAAGAKTLPIPIKYLMKFTAKIMTKTAYWI